jgi:hypothetical protein
MGDVLEVEPGGVEFDQKTFEEDRERADLCALANSISFPAGTKIVDAILKQYTIKRRRTIAKSKKDGKK